MDFKEFMLEEEDALSLELQEIGLDEAKMSGAQEKEYKARIFAHQLKNRGTWAQSKAVIDAEIKTAEKGTKASARAEKRKNAPARPKKVKIMSDKKFEKMMKDTRADLGADGMDVGQVASDVADSMLYDKDVELYVRHTIAKNTGKSPESISKTVMKEFLADNIYG